jgi:hypothetical protein
VTSDATHAYRGYRLQALYTLHRILKAEEGTNLVFQPEGEEDLAIFDNSGNLVEVNQVKSFKGNLVLSNFKPDKKDSFFYRVAELLRATPNVKITIISYSESPQLRKALQSDGKDRQQIAKKLGEFGYISESVAESLLSKIQIQTVSEGTLTQDVYNRLGDSLMGVDPHAAFELLHNWLYVCSEGKLKIARRDVIDRIHRVGKVLAERAAHLKEWGTTILPIQDQEIDDQTRQDLADEFYRGISTNYNHILADLDVLRQSRLEEITKKFEEARVVIVHGASGQGKSTLAYRYLHEHFPNEWRFRVELIESRQHALSIATALAGQADAMGMPIAVYLDVSPSDKDWPEFVRNLSVHRNIRMLVTVREEDLQRASLSGAEMRFAEVDLVFSQDEAREIYQSLAEKHTPSEFLDFEEAWRRFGGEGPLMEFVYLVTQGNTLRERLAEQVAHLEDNVRCGVLQPAELKLLRLVSVASAYEARLKVKPLVTSLGLILPERTLHLFEKEYLLRLSADGSLAFGLHPIRSGILTELLTDPALTPWSKAAQASLPFMHDADIETFLLYAFSRRPDDIESMYQALASFQPDQWTAISGITRSLIWLGIREYIVANRQLIGEAVEDSGRGWAVILDCDIADVIPNGMGSIWQTIGRMVPEDRREKMVALQSRQSDKGQVFVRVRDWLVSRTNKPLPPQTDSDWAGMAETIFWIGRFGLSWPLAEWLADTPFEVAIDTLPIELLADVTLGTSFGCPHYFRTWIANNRSRIITRFRKATRTVAVEDDGQKVTAHFIVELEPSGNSATAIDERIHAAKDRLHEEAIVRIELMRKLFPDREYYACQGYGHKDWLTDPSHDGTQKTGVGREQFPPIWLTSVNSTFHGLAEWEFRPRTWQEFTTLIVRLREDVITALRQLVDGLERYFQSRELVQAVNDAIDMNFWVNCVRRLDHMPLLPMCAVDEWGLVDESTSESASHEMQGRTTLVGRKGLAVRVYRPFLDELRNYVTHFSNFFKQSVGVMNLNPVLGRIAKDGSAKARVMATAEQQGIKESTGRLSTLNLAEAVKSVRRLQWEFRHLLSKFVAEGELDRLDRQEENLCRHVWNLWYVFETQPQRVVHNTHVLTAQVIEVLNQVRQSFQKECRKLSNDNVKLRNVSETLLWELTPALWMTIDGKDAIETYNAVENVIVALRKAVARVPDTPLRRYVLDFHWPFVVVIPLVRGKSFLGTAWRWHLPFLLTGSELKWWQFWQFPISPETMEALKITTWEYPGLELAEKLVSSTAALSFYVGHISDFLNLPALDDEGIAQVQDYLQQVGKRVSEVLQSAADATSDICRIFNQLPPEKKQNRPNLVAAMQVLIELRPNILHSDEFNGEVRLDLAATAEWAERLKKARDAAGLLYLLWASDVIDAIEGK